MAGYGIGESGSSGGGGGTPSAPENSVQFNDAGAFGGDANFTWDGDALVVAGAMDVNRTTLLTSIGDTAGVHLGQGIVIDNTANQFVKVGDNGLGAGNGTYIAIEDSSTKRYIALVGGQSWYVTNGGYGITNTLTPAQMGIYLSGGTGATVVDISDANFPVGAIVMVADLDGISAASNITIDSGTGNTITNQAGSAQTAVLATDGISVTIQKFTATKWMVISTN